MSRSDRVIKNTAFLYIRMAFTILISMYSTRLILNSLGASDFGIFGIVGGAIGMLSFLNGTMAQATQRFISFAEGEGGVLKKNKVFNVSIVLHIAISVLVFLLLEVGQYFFFGGVLRISPERMIAAKAIYQFMVASTILTILTVTFDATINANEDMLFFSITGILETLLKLLAAIYIVHTNDDKLISYGLLITIITIIILIVKAIYCKLKYKDYSIKLIRYFDQRIFKKFSSFIGWNFVGSTGSLVGNYGSGIIVNHYFGTSVNAAQSITGQLNGQLLAFTNNILKAVNPVIVKSEGGGDRNSLMRYTITGSKIAYILFAILAIPFLIETEYILRAWLKTVPEWTTIFCRLFVVTTMIQQFTITFATSIGATGKIKSISIFNALICLLPNALYVLIFSFGGSPIWLYILVFLNLGVITGIMFTYECKKHCDLDVNYFLQNVVVKNVFVTLIVMVVGVAIYLNMSESIIRFALISLICPLLFLILTYKLSLDNQEKLMIDNILLKITRR